MSQAHEHQEDNIFMEFLHKAKEYIYFIAAVVAALAYLSYNIDKLSHGNRYISWTLYIAVVSIIFTLYFFTIRPAIIKKRELNLRPTGEPDEEYFTTSPRTDDKFHFFSSGYENYLTWLHNPKAPVLYLTGPSGSGKSSLINAYLVPQLEKAGTSKTNVFPLRSYHDPLTVLYNAFAIEDNSNKIINEENVIIEIEKATKLLSPGEKILIVLDQFEEFFLLRNSWENITQSEEETGSIEELKNFFHRFINNPPKGVYILLSYRDDFQELIDQLELPARSEHINFEQVKLLNFDKATQFLKNCPGLNIPEQQLNRILKEATSIDTPLAIRPIVLNLCGIIVQRMISQKSLLKKKGNLIRQYILDCLGKELKQERVRVLKEMLTDFNTARPRNILELSKASKLNVSQLDNQMLSMQHHGLVRCLDGVEATQGKRKWQIAHDFVALQLEKVVFGINKTIWQKGKPWLAPILTCALIIFASYITSSSEDLKKKKAIANIERAGFTWIEQSKTLSSFFTLKIPVNTTFQSIVNDFIILQPDSLSILFDSDTTKKQIINLNGLNQVRSLRKIVLEYNDRLKNLEDLKGLKDLTFLDVNSCHNLQNIDALRGLKGLTYLDVGGCDSLLNIDGLIGSSALTDLYLYRCNNLKNIDGLKALKSLTNLDLSARYDLRDCEVLKNLTGLTNLDLSQCENLKNIDGLSNLTALTELNLYGCKNLKNIDGLSNLTALTELKLNNCKNLQDIDGLRNLISLTELQLDNCKNLQNIDELKHLTNLKFLNLSHCPKISKPTIDELWRSLPQLQTFITDYFRYDPLKLLFHFENE